MQDTDRITVEMSAAEWNQVLGLLAEQPFKVVAPLIGQIQQQAMKQDTSPGLGMTSGQQPPSPTPPTPKPDGAMAPEERLTGGTRRQPPST